MTRCAPLTSPDNRAADISAGAGHPIGMGRFLFTAASGNAYTGMTGHNGCSLVLGVAALLLLAWGLRLLMR